MTVTDHNLVQIGQGVYALISPRRGFGYSNVGLVIDHDGLTLIDTTATPEQAALVARAVDRLTVDLGLPVKRVVITSGRVVHCGGGQVFWSAAFYGTETTSRQLDAPANPVAWRALLPDFAPFYHDDFTTRPVTHLVTETAQLTPAITVTPLVGESAGNLTVHVESANVVFAGALASFGVTPLAFDGYHDPWIENLRRLVADDTTVIPGHGPPGGRVDLEEQAAYLDACRAARVPSDLAPGPWDGWTDRRFDPINIERARLLEASRDEPPQSMLRLLGLNEEGSATD